MLHRTAYISLLIYLPLVLLLTIVGLALHATYVHCDPVVSKTISSGDQVRVEYVSCTAALPNLGATAIASSGAVRLYKGATIGYPQFQVAFLYG